MPDQPLLTRWIGLDLHKHYFVAVGVDGAKRTVFGPHKVPNEHLDAWIARHLLASDAVVMEMTTNTYVFHDALVPHVGSIMVVHPPNVRLITGVRVKTDKKAALSLAQLHAAGLLAPVWIPPLEVRHLRAVIAQRAKMVRLSTQAKNRLTSLLHRIQQKRPDKPFAPEQRTWWESLPLSPMERYIVLSDLDTLAFAGEQVAALEAVLRQEAARDERVPLLTQLPGVAMLTALTILAAVGTIARFEAARHLVGYAGLGASVHDSGETHASGHITRHGRRDLRGAMVDAANAAVRHHPYWKKEFERLEFRLGRSRAIVAIARRLLVAAWHILRKEAPDRHADATRVAASFFKLAYEIRVCNLPAGMSARAFTRNHLDRLGIGADLDILPWGTKRVKLPPSALKTKV